MGTFTTIFYILLFAVVTAVIYVWGLKRAYTKSDDVYRILMSKCSKKVLKHLDKNNTISEKEIAALIDNTKAGLLWSKDKMKITDGKKFAKEIITFMIDKKYIIKNGSNYVLYN